MHLPKDPAMLLSVVNTKLRDFYPSLEALCEEADAAPEEIAETLAKLDFHYDPEQNQFV